MLEGLSNAYVFSDIVHWPQKKKNPGYKKTPKTQIVIMHIPSTIHLVSPGSKVWLWRLSEEWSGCSLWQTSLFFLTTLFCQRTMATKALFGTCL